MMPRNKLSSAHGSACF